MHGGMGFTWEFDCHLYYRRSNAMLALVASSERADRPQRLGRTSSSSEASNCSERGVTQLALEDDDG